MFRLTQAIKSQRESRRIRRALSMQSELIVVAQRTDALR
jgi:hypothetical protein